MCNLFGEPGKEPVTFVEKYDIKVNESLKGDQVFIQPWDKFLKFKGETRTFAEYSYEERIPVWARYYEKMAKYISSLKPGLPMPAVKFWIFQSFKFLKFVNINFNSRYPSLPANNK